MIIKCTLYWQKIKSGITQPWKLKVSLYLFLQNAIKRIKFIILKRNFTLKKDNGRATDLQARRPVSQQTHRPGLPPC